MIWPGDTCKQKSDKIAMPAPRLSSDLSRPRPPPGPCRTSAPASARSGRKAVGAARRDEHRTRLLAVMTANEAP
jgi:hypothetical protein